MGQLAHSLWRDKSLVILCTAIALSCLLSVARSFSLLCKRPDLERLLVVLRFLLSTVPHPKCITLQVLSPFCFCGSTTPFELKARLQDTGHIVDSTKGPSRLAPLLVWTRNKTQKLRNRFDTRAFPHPESSQTGQYVALYFTVAPSWIPPKKTRWTLGVEYWNLFSRTSRCN